MDKIIVNFFAPNHNMIRQVHKNSISYERINTKNDFIITFIKEKKPPYNVYDSSIIHDEFAYKQLIIFDILKDVCSVDEYKDIIRFCMYLQVKTNCKILITSDAHNDICIIENKKVLWSKEKKEIFS